MLLPRFLTAIVGLPLLIGATLMGGLPFFFLVLGVVLIGLREFYFLAQESGYPCYLWEGMGAGFLLTVSVFLNGVGFGQSTENQLTSALIAMALIYLVVRGLWRGPTETLLSEWGITFFGVFYVAWSLSHLLLVRDLRPHGQGLTFLLWMMIWVEDIVAYWVGTRWGRHPIAHRISPKKTWEGTLGGLVGVLIVISVFQMTLFRDQLKRSEALGLGLIVGALAFVSDLGESLLKRNAGVKESSHLLPGHGGILDRFDSFILTAPFFYYYWAFFKR